MHISSIWYTFFPLLAVLGFSSFQSQPVLDIHGKVYDAQGEPLTGVHVYLANTTFGTVTDAVGAFILDDIPEGSYLLVTSMIGFEAKTKSVSVWPGEMLDIKVYLKDVVYNIPEITVVEKFPRRWKQDLKRFKRAFLGNRFEAKGCDIVNPYILDFERDKQVLYASAEEPLIVENKSLGYKITFNLADFVISGVGYGHRFVGNPYYEYLPVEDEATREEIARRRDELYEGSMIHFFRSAAKGITRKEGFKTYVAPGAYWKTPEAMRLAKVHDDFKVALDTLIFESEDPDKRYLMLRSGDYLHVTYAKERMHNTYMIDMRIHTDYWKHPQISVMSREELSPELAHPYFNGDTTLVAFNEMGYLYDQYVLGLYGYWNWESGICDALPYNYRWNENELG